MYNYYAEHTRKCDEQLKAEYPFPNLGHYIYFYTPGDIRALISRYQEIASLLDQRYILTKDNFIKAVPQWFADQFPNDGYLFDPNHIVSQLKLTFNEGLVGARIGPEIFENYIDMVYDIDVDRPHCGYHYLGNGIGAVSYDIREWPVPTDDYCTALYLCGAAEVLPDF